MGCCCIQQSDILPRRNDTERTRNIYYTGSKLPETKAQNPKFRNGFLFVLAFFRIKNDAIPNIHQNTITLILSPCSN